MPTGVYVRTEKYKKEQSRRMKGRKRKPCSEKTKEKMSKSQMERFKDPEERRKISEIMKGKSHKCSPETKRKIGEANKGKVRSKELKKRLSIVQKGKVFSEKVRKNMSKTRKKQWQDPKFQKMMFEAQKIKPNKLEKYFGEFIGNNIRFVGDFSFWVYTKKGTRNPDFKVNGQRKIIELFGNYFHKEDNPKDKVKEYTDVGWGCKVFWESEVYNESERVLKETLGFIGS